MFCGTNNIPWNIIHIKFEECYVVGHKLAYWTQALKLPLDQPSWVMDAQMI